MTARSANSDALSAPTRIRLPLTGLTASYPPLRHSSATRTPVAARWPTRGPVFSRHQRPTSRTGRTRTREVTAIRSTASIRSLVAPLSEGDARVIPEAWATTLHTAYVVSSEVRAVRDDGLRDVSMEASNAWSACSRTASPALMPAAVRSSWARSNRSIQRSRVDSRRCCWLTMLCHIAASTSRSPAASAEYAAPYCTLPGSTGSHRMSSSATASSPAADRPSSGASYSTR